MLLRSSTLRRACPSDWKNTEMAVWYRASLMMFLHIAMVINGSVCLTVMQFICSFDGGSVINASPPRKVRTEFAHSDWITEIGEYPKDMVVMMGINNPAMVLASSNWIYFRRLWYVQLPHLIIVSKKLILASLMMMSELSLAISLLQFSITIPTSASFSAGISLVLPPTITTFFLFSFKCCIKRSLLEGEQYSITLMLSVSFIPSSVQKFSI